MRLPFASGGFGLWLEHDVPNQKIDSYFSYNAPRGTIARVEMTWSFYFLFLSSLFSPRLTRKYGSPFSSSDCHSTHFPRFATNKKQNIYLQGPGRATENDERRDIGRCSRGDRGALRQTTGGIGEGVRSGRRTSVVRRRALRTLPERLFKFFQTCTFG